MKKLVISLCLLFFCINSSFALTVDDIPNNFDITQHWISLTTSFDIGTKNQKLGTLYRKFYSLLLAYEFFDPNDNRLAIARSRFFSVTAHFDVYDNNDVLLGVAEEKLFSFFPTFVIYANDGSTKLANAEMNFWGTTFTIYDSRTKQEIANMHRSFFRLKNDWTFTVINRPLLVNNNIDPRVLLTVAAFQGDREYWESKNYLSTSNQTAAATPQKINLLLEKVNNLSNQRGSTGHNNYSHKRLEAVANELEIGYKNSQFNHAENQTNQDKVNNFTEYCLAVVQENGVSDTKKEEIIYLLKTRLEGGII